MAIKLGPNDRLVIRGVESGDARRRDSKSHKTRLRSKIASLVEEIKELERSKPPRWHDRILRAQGGLQQLRSHLAWISKEENRKK